MRAIFDSSPFNRYISGWDTSQVTNMYCMFYHSKFKGDISKWNIQSLEISEHMFAQCKNDFIPPWANKNKEQLREYQAFILAQNISQHLDNNMLNIHKEHKKMKI